MGAVAALLRESDPTAPPGANAGAEQAVLEAGDALKKIIHRALEALMARNQKAVWQILDVDAVHAIQDWNGACGRPVGEGNGGSRRAILKASDAPSRIQCMRAPPGTTKT
jgi:hypothetical protein